MNQTVTCKLFPAPRFNSLYESGGQTNGNRKKHQLSQFQLVNMHQCPGGKADIAELVALDSPHSLKS